MKTALTIAGSDSSGGAGIQADLKTFSALGVYGMSVITAVTAQNTQGVFGVQELSPEIIAGQLDAVFQDMPVDSVKIGMLSSAETIKVITEKLQQYQPRQVVLDPVMVSKSGYDLLKPEAKAVLIEKLLPLATVITPNLKETGELIDRPIKTLTDMEQAARALVKKGPKAALVKGGHLEGDAIDVLFNGESLYYFEGKRIATKNTHGTGCTLSSAIASYLARGFSLEEAIKQAKTYIQGAIANALNLGSGAGPTHHFHGWYPKEGILK